MPEGMEPPSNGEMPEGMEPPSNGEMPEGFEPPANENWRAIKYSWQEKEKDYNENVSVYIGLK